jgi:hypothetical protein
MGGQQLLLRQELTISQILRIWMQFRQITERYSDGGNGRCALGVIMRYQGWKGQDDSQAANNLLGTLIAVRCTGVDKTY